MYSMIDRNLTNIRFQTFFVSREQSNCPLITDIARLGKELKDSDILENVTSVIVSLGYGKRILINSDYTDFTKIKRENLLEIVDYDPVKKVLLAIGSGEPPIETPVHWMIHHARDDVNAIVQINNEELSKKLAKKYPATEGEKPSGTLDLAKEILKTLRTSKNIVIKNKGILFVGNNVKEVESTVLKICEDLK